MQPAMRDARNDSGVDSEAKWIRLAKQLFLDLAYMSLVGRVQRDRQYRCDLGSDT